MRLENTRMNHNVGFTVKFNSFLALCRTDSVKSFHSIQSFSALGPVEGRKLTQHVLCRVFQILIV